jgi:hypothetical protein
MYEVDATENELWGSHNLYREIRQQKKAFILGDIDNRTIEEKPRHISFQGLFFKAPSRSINLPFI